jgi:cytidine deaminase
MIMKKIKLEIDIESCKYAELQQDDKKLVDEACEATKNSYAPYSKFSVGAAALLKNGIIIKGNNQENAAYPSGICAERTTIFYANAQYPEQPVVTLAIAARNEDGFLDSPIPPCGACRQVLLETEKRFGKAMRVILYSNDDIYIVKSVKDLLPLSFDESFLK